VKERSWRWGLCSWPVVNY